MRYAVRVMAGLVVVAAVVVVVAAGCGEYDADSLWCDHDVVIDGMDDGAEWEHARFFFDEQQVTVGILNDDEMLYLRLSTRDTGLQRSIRAAGLTIWLDAGGKQEKTFGIRYPTGMNGLSAPGGVVGGRGELPSNGGERPDFYGGDEEPPPVPGDDPMSGEGWPGMGHRGLAIGDRLEIIGPVEGETRTLTRAGADSLGLSVAIDADNDNMVYEIAIPLRRSVLAPFGIDVGPITQVGVGFEGAKLSAGSRPEGPMGGRRGGGGGMGGDSGGMGGMGGRGGGRSGGPGGGGGMREMSTPLSLWMKVALAPDPAR